MYKGENTSTIFILLTIVYTLIMLWLTLLQEYFIYPFIAVLLFYVIALLFYTSYSITDNKVIYHFHFLFWTIYKKEITPEQMKLIKFKRVHWTDRIAKITFHKGLAIRIHIRKQPKFYEQLLQFCNENNIPYEKTKDYLLLEKYY